METVTDGWIPRRWPPCVEVIDDPAGIRYFVPGSMASMAFGEYRTTTDLDIVVELD